MSLEATGFTYQIVTPDGSVDSGVCEFLVACTSRGEIGILANHEPLLSDVVAGELRLTRGGKVVRYRVGGGVLEVAGNAVTLLLERAVAGAEDESAPVGAKA